MTTLKWFLKKLDGKLLLPSLSKELTRELGDIIIVPRSTADRVKEILSEVKQSVRFVFDDDVDNLLDFAKQNIDASGEIVRNGFIHRKPGADDKRETVLRLQKQIDGYEDDLKTAQESSRELEEKLPELVEKTGIPFRKEGRTSGSETVGHTRSEG